IRDRTVTGVQTCALPILPLRFWNDPGDRRYLETYFQEFPGVWRHGDFFKISPEGSCWVLGRSDATLNRYGVRIGTAEVYRSLGKIGRAACRERWQGRKGW